MRALILLVLLLALSACGGSESPDTAPSSPDASPTSASPTPTPSATPTPTPEPPRPPRTGSCHRLGYDAVLSPTDESDPVPCSSQHTTATFSVGDVRRVQQRVATVCPQRFAAFVGGTPEDRQLSMLRPVWFTPTAEEQAAGASWFRCDVVATARDSQLALLTGPLAGILDRPEEAARYGLCGTAAPGSKDFERVICVRQHSWRAVATVPLEPGAYPGVEAARSAGDTQCEDVGADAADGALDYQWGYEWPTAAQWKAGQTYGICWVPAS